MAVRVLASRFNQLPEKRLLLSAAGFSATQSQRTVVLPPQTWYFVDTEGNLRHTERKKRYYNPKSVDTSGPGQFSLENVEKLLQESHGDLPMKGLPDPYKKARHKCLLCKYNVEVDYKNTRLLSQFVSRFTGKLYDRQTTGLCRYQSERVIGSILLARKAGYMPFMYTEPIFFHDPKLFDPFRPARKS